MAGVPVCRPQPTEIDGYYTSRNFMTHAYSDPLVLGQVLVILWQSKDTWKERFPSGTWDSSMGGTGRQVFWGWRRVGEIESLNMRLEIKREIHQD